MISAVVLRGFNRPGLAEAGSKDVDVAVLLSDNNSQDRSLIAQRSRYALKALIRLVPAGPGVSLSTRVIAAEEAIPVSFLEQIMLELRRAGFVGSRLGKEGGYILDRDPSSDRQIATLPSIRAFSSARMFFRPQHARLSNHAGALPGTIRARRRVGPVSSVEIALAGTDRVIEVDVSDSASVQIGQRAGV